MLNLFFLCSTENYQYDNNFNKFHKMMFGLQRNSYNFRNNLKRAFIHKIAISCTEKSLRWEGYVMENFVHSEI